MPTKERGVVITAVREGRDVREAAELQLDCNLANLVFLVLRFGGHFQHSSKHKQTWREMLTNSSPNKVYQNEVRIYISILCCFIFQGTAKQHDPRLPSTFPYMDLKGFRPSLRDNTLVEKVTKPTLKTVPLSVNE